MTEVPRIGLGTDLHRLVPGRLCVLGGVPIECPVGPESHSDGDPVLHALTDALLGAAGLPDLGSLFPDKDPRWHNAPSTLFVRAAMEMLAARGLTPGSADIVVHCERPRLGPYRDAMRGHIATLLGLPVDRVNVKGKSLEGTGGEQETVSATAVVLVVESRAGTPPEAVRPAEG